jgi:betaine-homocysteine S-methyltransferase
MADYAMRAQALGVNYIGICCGGAPHYVRAIAGALGRTVPASKYSPAIELHTKVEEKEKEFLVDGKG